MEAFYGIIGTLVGALIAAISIYMNEKIKRDHESKKEKKELLIKKYEEIFVELNKYIDFSHLIAFQMLKESGFGGKFDPEKIITTPNICQLEMNIQFYAPSLSSYLTEIKKHHRTISEHMAEFLMNKDSDLAEKGIRTGSVGRAAQELMNVSLQAQKNLSESAQRIINV